MSVLKLSADDPGDLIRESHRLREDLLRVAARLQGFAEQLQKEVALLREASGDDDPEVGPARQPRP